jgi:hypothetical protein
MASGYDLYTPKETAIGVLEALQEAFSAAAERSDNTLVVSAMREAAKACEDAAWGIKEGQ